MVLVAMVTVEFALVVVSTLSPKWRIVSALGISVKLCTNDTGGEGLWKQVGTC